MQRRQFLQHFTAASVGAGVFAGPVVAAPAQPVPVVSKSIKMLAHRVLSANDPGQRPFAIVDKHTATIALYLPSGAVAGVSRTLLGQARGDRSLPGVGERTQSGRLRPQDLTTPAGRFESIPGRNREGEAIVWLDYGTAFAIHRLRPGASQAERARRLASGSVADKRGSAGCVVVPEPFYDQTVAGLLGRRPGVVYVMPEETAPHESWLELWRQVSARQMA
ncbi:MAG TPA: L,D-transpeptidase [Rubrivivax sp.]|nr:L,D-transpeptidase [Rubrivivax sp.]